jgi:hypothetical protein
MPGAPGPGATFDGGYAQVIRPAEHRGRPNPGPSAPPADQDVFVYRDPAEPTPKSSPRPASADDASYWYDLLAEDPVPPHEEARGPFEPLQASQAPAAQQAPGGPGRPPSAAPRDENPEQARARKLEQLKDLYLTAEAIGERNVDKHFDELLAQQREPISEYFRQSPAAQPGGASSADGQVPPAEAERRQAERRQAAGQATPPEGVSVRAEPPRAW